MKLLFFEKSNVDKSVCCFGVTLNNINMKNQLCADNLNSKNILIIFYAMQVLRLWSNCLTRLPQ